MSLTASNLSLALSGAQLLNDVSLSVEPGQITTVLGPNGAGKTTLLRVLVGEMTADDGSMSLAGRALRDWPAAQLAQIMAVLPQHSLLNFPFTAAEVVMLGRTPHATGFKRDREIVAQALEVVDGDYLAGRFYTQLSGGEKQRVHLARVLAQIWEPVGDSERYLVLDEPTSSFDLAHQRLTLDVVRNLGQQGVGVLMVIHDLNLASQCADQMLLMQCGSIVASGTPEAVLQPETITSVFKVDANIGIHPVNGTPLVIT